MRAGFDPLAPGAGVVELLTPCSGPRGGVREALSKLGCLEAQLWWRGFLPASLLLLWAPGSLFLAQPWVAGSREQLGAEEPVAQERGIRGTSVARGVVISLQNQGFRAGWKRPRAEQTLPMGSRAAVDTYGRQS